MKASRPYVFFISTCAATLHQQDPNIPHHINAVNGVVINCVRSPYIQPLKVQYVTLLHLPLLYSFLVPISKFLYNRGQYAIAHLTICYTCLPANILWITHKYIVILHSFAISFHWDNNVPFKSYDWSTWSNIFGIIRSRWTAKLVVIFYLKWIIPFSHTVFPCQLFTHSHVQTQCLLHNPLNHSVPLSKTLI